MCKESYLGWGGGYSGWEETPVNFSQNNIFILFVVRVKCLKKLSKNRNFSTVVGLAHNENFFLSIHIYILVISVCMSDQNLCTPCTICLKFLGSSDEPWEC